MAEQRGGFGCLVLSAIAFAVVIVVLVALRRPTAQQPPSPKPTAPVDAAPIAVGALPRPPVSTQPTAAGHHPVWINPASGLGTGDLEKLLDQPIVGLPAGPLVFMKLDAKPYEPRVQVAFTARQYLDLYSRGYGPALSDAVAIKKVFYQRVAEPVQFLRRAMASARSHVARLQLGAVDLAQWPARMVGGDDGPWIEHEPELTIQESNASHLITSSPFAQTTVELIARADFNADGTQDLLVTIHRQPKTGTAAFATVVLSRDRAGGPLRWVESPPLDDNRNLGRLRIAHTDDGQVGLFERHPSGRKLVSPIMQSVRVLHFAPSPSGQYAMVWSLLRVEPPTKIVEIFDMKTGLPIEQVPFKPHVAEETLRWISGDRMLRHYRFADADVYTVYTHSGRKVHEEEVRAHNSVSPGGRYLLIHNKRTAPVASRLSVLDLTTIESVFVSDKPWDVKSLKWAHDSLRIQYKNKAGEPQARTVKLEAER
jgi:hypothetical protein